METRFQSSVRSVCSNSNELLFFLVFVLSAETARRRGEQVESQTRSWRSGPGPAGCGQARKRERQAGVETRKETVAELRQAVQLLFLLGSGTYYSDGGSRQAVRTTRDWWVKTSIIIIFLCVSVCHPFGAACLFLFPSLQVGEVEQKDGSIRRQCG